MGGKNENRGTASPVSVPFHLKFIKEVKSYAEIYCYIIETFEVVRLMIC